MPSTLCCLIAAAAASVAAGASVRAATAGIKRDGDTGGPSPFDGLADSLKSGGAEGLLAALSSMEAARPHEASYNVVKDKDGRLMYDFAHPKTDAPTATTTTLPLLAAAQAAMERAAALTGHALPPPMVPPAPHGTVPAKPAASTFMAPAVPAVAAPAAQPVAPAVPAVAIAPIDPAAARAAAPPPPAAPAAPLAPTAPQAPMAGASAGGGALAALAARLDALRQQVDSLSAQADAAVGGAPMPLAAGVAAAAPQPATPPPAPQVPPQLQAELKDVLRRVKALENENHQLHQQVDSQSAYIAKIEGTQKADELQLAQVKMESDNITALIHRKHHKKAKVQ